MTKKKEKGPRKDAASTAKKGIPDETVPVETVSSAETASVAAKVSSDETVPAAKVSSAETASTAKKKIPDETATAEKVSSAETATVKTNGENGVEFDGKARKETLAILSIGCGLETAANYVGIPMGRIRKEIRRNGDFARDVRRAEERAEIFFLTQIKKAAEKEQYWRAAAWALERKAPNRYAARGAETMTIDDIREIFRKLAEIVLAEVSASDDRKRAAAKIRRLLADLAAVHEDGKRKTKRCNTGTFAEEEEKAGTAPRSAEGTGLAGEGQNGEFSSETFSENETIDFEKE